MKRPATLALIFLFALTIRLIAIWIVGPSQLEFGDSFDYLETSRYICLNGDYPEQGNLPFFRAPGLPFFICLVTACNIQKVTLIKVCLAAVDSTTVLFIWFLACRVGANSRFTLLAAAIAAMNPFFVFQVTDVLSEPLFMFFLSGAGFRIARSRFFGDGSGCPLGHLHFSETQ